LWHVAWNGFRGRRPPQETRGRGQPLLYSRWLNARRELCLWKPPTQLHGSPVMCSTVVGTVAADTLGHVYVLAALKANGGNAVERRQRPRFWMGHSNRAGRREIVSPGGSAGDRPNDRPLPCGLLREARPWAARPGNALTFPLSAPRPRTHGARDIASAFVRWAQQHPFPEAQCAHVGTYHALAPTALRPALPQGPTGVFRRPGEDAGDTIFFAPTAPTLKFGPSQRLSRAQGTEAHWQTPLPGPFLAKGGHPVGLGTDKGTGLVERRRPPARGKSTTRPWPTDGKSVDVFMPEGVPGLWGETG